MPHELSLVETIEENALPRSRGAITRADGRVCIGRVGAPVAQEATSECFTFWVPPDALVEKTQLVTCESRIAGQDFVLAISARDDGHADFAHDLRGVGAQRIGARIVMGGFGFAQR